MAIFVHGAINTKKQRALLKKRSNEEFEADNLDNEYYTKRLSESEFMYEDLEETYYMHISLLVGLAVQLYWGVWYISLAVGISLAVIGIKFLALKPFLNSIPSNDIYKSINRTRDKSRTC